MQQLAKSTCRNRHKKHKHVNKNRPDELHIRAQALQQLANKLGGLQALVLQTLVGADLQCVCVCNV